MKIGWIALVTGAALLACLTPFTSWYATSRVEDVATMLAFFLILAGAFLAAPASAPRTWLQRTQGFVTRVAVAVALNLLYWVVVIEPHVFYDEKPSFTWQRITGLVDLPIAILGLGDKFLRSYRGGGELTIATTLDRHGCQPLPLRLRQRRRAVGEVLQQLRVAIRPPAVFDRYIHPAVRTDHLLDARRDLHLWLIRHSGRSVDIDLRRFLLKSRRRDMDLRRFFLELRRREMDSRRFLLELRRREVDLRRFLFESRRRDVDSRRFLFESRRLDVDSKNSSSNRRRRTSTPRQIFRVGDIFSSIPTKWTLTSSLKPCK